MIVRRWLLNKRTGDIRPYTYIPDIDAIVSSNTAPIGYFLDNDQIIKGFNTRKEAEEYLKKVKK